MIQAGFDALGIRRRPFGSLVRAFLLMDLRSQHFARATGSKPGELIPPLFWVLGQYVLASGIVSAALFCRVGVESFALAGLTVSMLLSAAAVIVEFNEVLLSPEDPEILGHRALDGATYAAARVTNLAFFVLLSTAGLNLFPAVLGSALRDSSPLFFPAYLVAALVGNVAAVTLVSLVYAGMADRGADHVRDLLAWTQILLVLVFFYGAQWMLRDGSHQLLGLLSSPPDWVAWLPPAVLASWVAELVRGSLSGETLRQQAALLVTLGLALAWLLLRVAAAGRALSATDTAAGPMKRADLVGPVSRRLGRTGPQSAVIALCFAALRRDHDLRMRVLPALVTVPALVLLGLLTGQLGNSVRGPAGNAVVSLASVVLVVAAVPSMVHAMTLSRHDECAWVLCGTPDGDRASAHAARIAVCWGIALPALTLVSAVFALAWHDPLAAAVQLGLGWLQVQAAGLASVRALGFRAPLSSPAARGELLGAVAPWWAAVVTLASLAAAGQAWAMESAPRLLLVAGALGAICLAAREASR